MEIAVGERTRPERATLYQQLHGYPVGTASSHLAEKTHGAKYHIAPVRRELLVGLDVVIGVRSSSDEVAKRVGQGLRGELATKRYGLPFAGDNNLLFDHIDIVPQPPSANWYTKVEEGQGPRRHSCRLTVGIDREDSSRTTTVLAAPEANGGLLPPIGAWNWVPRQPETAP
jgi:CRISPR-associated protein Cas5t